MVRKLITKRFYGRITNVPTLGPEDKTGPCDTRHLITIGYHVIFGTFDPDIIEKIWRICYKYFILLLLGIFKGERLLN